MKTLSVDIETEPFKGYDFPGWTFDGSEVLDTKTIKAAVEKLRMNTQQRKVLRKTFLDDFKSFYDESWLSKGWTSFLPKGIPAVDFFQTVSARALERLLESAAFGSRPSPHLLLLYLDVKEANEKATFERL